VNAGHGSPTQDDAASPPPAKLFEACEVELRLVAARLMRGERSGHTLQPTALVNEAYLRLCKVDELRIEDRIHFVNIAARAMRQILVEHARRRSTAKRGGGVRTITLSGAEVADVRDEVGILELHDALETLGAHDPRSSEIVELRVFGGLTMEEISVLLGISRRTAQKDWRFAKLWLRKELSDGGGPGARRR